VTWSQHNGKYLSGYSSGQHNYPNLQEAAKQCYQRKDCGGITFEPKTKKFTLRKGTSLKKSPSHEISWTKTTTSTTGKGGATSVRRTSTTVRRVNVSWSQHNGKYLSGYSSGQHNYPNLQEAAKQCYQRKDCGGITFEPKTKKFTLRKGTSLKNSPSHEISWTKTITTST